MEPVSEVKTESVPVPPEPCASANVPVNVIGRNEFAVVHKVGGTYPRVVKLINKNQILIEKLKFIPDNAFGLPYGTKFDVKHHKKGE